MPGGMRLAPYTPQENPVEDIWLKGKTFVRTHALGTPCFEPIKNLFVEGIRRKKYTEKEALENLENAVDLLVAYLLEIGEAIPSDPPSQIQVSDVSLVAVASYGRVGGMPMGWGRWSAGFGGRGRTPRPVFRGCTRLGRYWG